MPDLTPYHLAILQALRARGFAFIAFPMYASCIGARKGNCAALLSPLPSGAFRLVGDPGRLVAGQMSVRVHRKGKLWFVWKQQSVEATRERLAELDTFAAELRAEIEAAPDGGGACAI